ncbi:MAG: hypothetical protein IJL87_00560 [Clostridia bacterium]|nr:hypothetical protein [Clostridia bacterium]
MEELTVSQKKILEYLRCGSSNGIPPTVREICAATGIKSTSSVHTNLCVLEQKGYIKRESGINRSIRLTETASTITIPLAVELSRDDKGNLRVSRSVASIPYPLDYSQGQRELFAVRVSDDRLEGEGILDGDIIIGYFCADVPVGESAVLCSDGVPYVDKVTNEIKNSKKENKVIIAGKIIACMRFYG